MFDKNINIDFEVLDDEEITEETIDELSNGRGDE